jgi:hypothetical protein
VNELPKFLCNRGTGNSPFRPWAIQNGRITDLFEKENIMEKSVNLAAVATVEETVKVVSNQSVKDTRGVFRIGETLSSAKEQLEKQEYSKVFDQLPFGETVGDKLIAIHKCEWLRQISETENCKNLPYGYTNLYPLTKKELNDVKERKEFFIEAFTSGEFEDSDGNTVSTNKLTVGLIDKKIAQFLGVKTDPTNPVELDLVVGEIRVKKSTFENHDKYLELIKILGELSKQDFSVSDIGFVDSSLRRNNVKKS